MAQKHKFTHPDQIIEAAKTCDDPVTEFMCALWHYLFVNKPLMRKVCRMGGYRYINPANAQHYFEQRLFDGIAIDGYALNSYTGDNHPFY